MNALVVYYTKFGNTRRVAEAIAEALSRAGDALVVDIDQLSAADLEAADLVVFGSPTHYQNLPAAVRDALQALPKRALSGKSVAAFDTSRPAWAPLMRMTAAHRLLPRLRRLGGRRVVRAETFTIESLNRKTEDRVDRLLPGQIERAQSWAETILEGMGA